MPAGSSHVRRAVAAGRGDSRRSPGPHLEKGQDLVQLHMVLPNATRIALGSPAISRLAAAGTVRGRPPDWQGGGQSLPVSSADLTPGVRVTPFNPPPPDRSDRGPPERGSRPERQQSPSGKAPASQLSRRPVDSHIQLGGGDVIVLRVAAPPGLRFRPGDAARPAVAPSACIPLAESGE